MNYQFPASSEHPPYYETYLAYVNPPAGSAGNEIDIIAHLKNEQDVMVKLLESLSEEKLNWAYEKGKWSIKEVVMHCMDTERIFSYRALCIARGEQASLPGYEQDDYAKNCNAKERSKESIIEEYTTNRAATIGLFKSFSETVHNQIGLANNNKVSVRALLYIIAGHEMHHAKVLRERYL